MTSNMNVTIIIPCRNEAEHISACLDSVLRFDFPVDKLEVLVVDGLSSDRTKEIVEEYSRADSRIRVLANPQMIAPAGMNVGIRAAKGDFLVRLDAHSEYPPSYLSDCLGLLLKTKAANAGGRFVTVPNGNGPWATPIAEVTSHRFGVGDGAFRVGTEAGYVDTVPYGTFHRDVFVKIGMFDERLTRNQDNEFNDRLRRAGYKIAFDPAITIRYKNQSTLQGLLNQAYTTGVWNVYTLSLHHYTFKWRRFVPLFFVLYLLSVPLVCSLVNIVYLAPAILYFVILTIFASISPCSIVCKLRVAVTFFGYHLSYGFGTLAGIANIISGKWISHLGKPLRP